MKDHPPRRFDSRGDRALPASISTLSTPYLASLFQRFQHRPNSVSPEWQRYFRSLVNGDGPTRPRHADHPQIHQLVRAFRVRGHLAASLNPLDDGPPEPPPELLPEFHGFQERHFDQTFETDFGGEHSRHTLRDLLADLRRVYCGSIGVQFMHIDSLETRNWLIGRLERPVPQQGLSREEQLEILARLTSAVVFEQFVRKKYIGAKTFSLEGAESLIPLLHLVIERAASHGVREIVMAMAHRGRLNVLANLLDKSPVAIFQEFEDVKPRQMNGRGDVKYHLGHSSDWTAADGRRIHLSLCFNPSHLEFVNPVALGRLRAKQSRFGTGGRDSGLCVMVHGDAGLAGEGIVQETLNLSELAGYTTGGSLHVVVNNQIGFTTPPAEEYSGLFPTDIFKTLQVPILHVNGEDPDAVAQAVKLAIDFRYRYHRDVVIDMYCYRRRGHNESDEPSFTQPVMYRQIESRPSVRDSYLQRLVESGHVTHDEGDQIADEQRERLERAFDQLDEQQGDIQRMPDTPAGIWKGYQGGTEPTDESIDTGVSAETLRQLLKRLNAVPNGFRLHKKIERFQRHRREMIAGDRPLDWSAAEALALASLASEGHRIRLAGQDAQRGTFSHRHAVLFDHENGTPWVPLAHLSDDQAAVEVVNSPLSEAGALAFEFGFSLDTPEALVMWEAQYGDFANAAQVIIDQYVASAEDKWRRLSGLVLLLPHGFEGRGPEHSSARLERYLLLAAEHNLQIVQPTTPAQFFHLLRRQVRRNWRKPLVVFTPKSLLRHKQVVSDIEELAAGRFQRVLPDTTADGEIRRVLLCSGKIYYELLAARNERECTDVAIVRLEQFYPLPTSSLQTALGEVPPDVPICWVQEEPENMGAWRYLRLAFGQQIFDHPLESATRPESASPATGSAASHRHEQEQLIDRVFEE